ncbi:MAG: gamma-glutamyltransferase family protein [Candidatus Helarchaeota archaeon]|nr:gamma-glutamyltransferase family protein [Candidatus Helarchaeota archaeon]
MKRYFNWKFPYASQRSPVLAKNVVAAAPPLVSQAGLQMLLKGGNAVDAAVAAAIAQTVLDPTMNGIGGDAFTIIWDGKKLVGLNASGRSPASWTPEYFSKYKTMPMVGWDTVTIPGAVSAWVELWRTYGQLSFQDLFKPAIIYAREGFFVPPIEASHWKIAKSFYRRKELYPNFAEAFLRNGKAPKAGEFFKFPAQAKTLELIAETEGAAFYSGELAKKIVEHAEKAGGAITLEDLENHKVTWEKLVTMDYKDVTLHEIPPNGQGLAALIMLGILKQFDISAFEPDSIESIHLQLEAMKLAFADAYRYVSDPSTLEFDPHYLLDESYLAKRATLIDNSKAQDFKYGTPKFSDTIYLTTADAEGIMVSYIQSNFLWFGSGIVVPGTGISLQNRGSGFTLEEGHPNQVGPRKRPFHTIIPAFVTQGDNPLMSFGVMGGPMQPQGHAQMMIRIFEYGQNPQAASDAPRWQVEKGLQVRVENNFNKETFAGLKTLGHKISKASSLMFGGAQIIFKLENGYLAASDHRKDGQAVGI